jgi:Xaa-Pro aminopeptidase
VKSELDTLMEARNLDALLVLGNATHNPPMYYLTGGGHVTGATLLKKRGCEPMLYCNDMEREEAAKSALHVIPYSTYNYDSLLKEAGGDPSLAVAIRFQQIFTDQNVRGRVGIYGITEVGAVFATFAHLKRLLPDVEIVGEARDNSLFMYTMETKDEAEVSRIRRVGEITTTVVGRVADFLTSSEVRNDEVLLKQDGSPLTIADVKSRMLKIPRAAYLPSDVTPGSLTRQELPPTCCAWDRPSFLIFTRVKQAAVTSMTLPGHGAWGMLHPNRRIFTTR